MHIHRRIWRIVNKKLQHLLFLNSDHYKLFQSDHGGATAGYDVFRDLLSKVGTFVCNPLPQSCVDEKMSGLEQMMASLYGAMKRPDVKLLLKEYESTNRYYGHGIGPDYDKLLETLRKAGAHPMIESISCEKVEQPELHIDKTKSCPKMIPLKCTHGIDGNTKR